MRQYVCIKPWQQSYNQCIIYKTFSGFIYALHNVSYAKQQVSCLQTACTACHADQNMPDVKASHTALQGAGSARMTQHLLSYPSPWTLSDRGGMAYES